MKEDNMLLIKESGFEFDCRASLVDDFVIEYKHSEDFSLDSLQIKLKSNTFPLMSIQSIHTQYCHTLTALSLENLQEQVKARTGENFCLADLLPAISHASTKSSSEHISQSDQLAIIRKFNGLKPFKSVSLGTGKGGRTTKDAVKRDVLLASETEAIRQRLISEAQQRENEKFEKTRNAETIADKKIEKIKG